MLINDNLCPAKFAELKIKVLLLNNNSFSETVSILSSCSNYTKSDIKSALVSLKADGKITIDDNGNIERT